MRRCRSGSFILYFFIRYRVYDNADYSITLLEYGENWVAAVKSFALTLKIETHRHLFSIDQVHGTLPGYTSFQI